MSYTAEDYILFIEQGRRDKISDNAQDIIAKRFRELERREEEVQTIIEQYKRRLEMISDLEMSTPEGKVRLTTKASCYRTLISELERRG